MSTLYSNSIQKVQELCQVLAQQGRVREIYEFGGFLLAESSTQADSAIDLLVLTLVHGNEAGSLLPLIQLLNEFVQGKTIPGSIGVLFCNQEAAAEDVRFLERDLNRCFGINNNDTLEGRRAQKIEELINRSKYLIDIHQTNYETKSDFFIFPENRNNIQFAAQICDKTPIITHGLDFSSDGYTSDTYASMRGITAITYEMGQIEHSAEQVEKTLLILKKSIEISCSGLSSEIAPRNVLQFGQCIKASSQKRLIPNLINFAQIKKGDILGYDHETPIQAEHDGYVLFPKYGQQAQKSSELCRLIR